MGQQRLQWMQIQQAQIINLIMQYEPEQKIAQELIMAG